MFVRTNTKKNTQASFLTKTIMCLSAYAFLSGTESFAASRMFAKTSTEVLTEVFKGFTCKPNTPQARHLSTLKKQIHQVDQSVSQPTYTTSAVPNPVTYNVNFTMQLDKRKAKEFPKNLEEILFAHGIRIENNISIYEIYPPRQNNYEISTTGC